jgi:hypothetical protein
MLRSPDTRERAKAPTTPSGCVLNWAHTASVNSDNSNNAWNFNANDNGNVNVDNDNRDNNNEVRCVGR